MLWKTINRHKSKLITPSLSSGVLYIITILNAPAAIKYTSSFIAEILAILLLLVWAKYGKNRTKKNLEFTKKEELSSVQKALDDINQTIKTHPLGEAEGLKLHEERWKKLTDKKNKLLDDEIEMKMAESRRAESKYKEYLDQESEIINELNSSIDKDLNMISEKFNSKK